MNKFLSLLLKLPVALVLGCIVALSLMQNDPWLKGRIERLMISSVSDIVGELFTVKVDYIDLLRGDIVMNDVSVASSNNEWSFACPQMRIHISWLSWFKGNGFDTTLDMHKPSLFTRYAKSAFAVEKPFYALVNAPLSVPLNIVRCASEAATVDLKAPAGTVSARCSSTTTIDRSMAVTKVLCSDGSVIQGKNLFAQDLSGKMTIEVPHNDTMYTLAMKLSCTRPAGKADSVDVPYHMYYRYAHGIGTCSWRSEDGLFALEADQIVEAPEGLVANVSLSGHLGELASYVVKDHAVLKATGTGSFKGTVCIADTGYRYAGDAQIEQARYKKMSLSSAKLSVVGDDKKVVATIEDAESSGMGLAGSLTAYLVPGEVTGSLRIARPFDGIPQCVLEKGNASITYKDT